MLLHFAEFHISYNVIDAQNAAVVPCQWRRRVAREKRPLVVLVRDQRVDGVTVGVDGSPANRTVFILYVVRLLGRQSAATDRFRKSLVGIGNLERNVANAVAMFSNVLGCHIIRCHGSRQNEIRLALAHRIGSALALARFQSAVSNLRKAESLAIEVGRLPGVAHPEFDVMNTFQL